MALKKYLLPATICVLFYGSAIWKWHTETKKAPDIAEASLLANADVASALLNREEYAKLLAKQPISRDDYNKILDPLFQFHKAHPEIAHIYTVTKRAGNNYVILDTTLKLAAFDPNRPYLYPSKGVEKLTSTDSGLERALEGTPATEKNEPVRNAYGADIARYIPLRTNDPQKTNEENIVGVLTLTMNREEAGKLETKATIELLWHLGIYTLLLGVCGLGLRLKNSEIAKSQTARNRIEEQFKTMTEKMPGVVYIFETRSRNEKGTLLFISGGTETLLNITPSEAKENWLEIVDMLPEENRSEERGNLQKARCEGSPWECEFQNPQNRAWIQNKATPKKDENGNIIWFGTLNDVTLQKQESEKLEETNEILKRISEAPDDSQTLNTICEYACGNNRKSAVLYLCQPPHIHPVAGNTAAEPLIDVLRKPRNIGASEGGPAVAAIQKSRLHIASIQDSNFYKNDEELRTSLLEAGAKSTTLYPLITKEGNCMGVLEILIPEYTAEERIDPKEEQAAHLALSALERHQNKKTLEENERKYRTLFETSPIGICETDETGATIFSNQAFQKTANSETLDKLSGENAQEGRKELRQGKNTLLADTTKIEKANGKHHLITFLSDISEQKQKEERAITSKETAEAANKAKSEFLAVMSHEIRTPLNGVIGFSQILQSMHIDETVRGIVAKIQQCGEALLATIDDILHLSKIEAGKIELETCAFNLTKTLEAVKDILTIKAQEKGIYIKAEADQLPPAIYGDETRIRQILLNLVGNAVKFTERGGVTILAVYKKPNLTFHIKDTGIGISPENQKKLFQPFSQADSSTTRKHGGTGLGLAICKKLAELMGGSIQLESVEGEGSHFTVQIPAHPADAIPDTKKQEVETEDLLPLNILVAEDDDMNRIVIREMLKGLGHTPEFAKNGREAVNKAQELQDWIDLILMDMRMPELDGIEATQIIREQEKATGKKQVPIFALTANALEEDKERCISAGMNNYISKPITDIGILKKALRQCQKARRKEIVEVENLELVAKKTPTPEPKTEPAQTPAIPETTKPEPAKTEEEAPAVSDTPTEPEIIPPAQEESSFVEEWGFGAEPTLEEESTGEEIVNKTTLSNFLTYIPIAKLKTEIYPPLKENCRIGCDVLLSDFATAKEKASAAHKMCGSLGTFGCTALDRLARELETHYQNSTEPAPGLKKLKALVEKTIEELENIINETI